MRKSLFAVVLAMSLAACSFIKPSAPYDSVSVVPDMNNPSSVPDSRPDQTGKAYQASPAGK